MQFKSIMTVWDSQERAASAMEMARRMTMQSDGHLDVLCIGIDRIQPGLYYAGATPIASGESIQDAIKEARESEENAKAYFDGSALNWSSQSTVAQISGLSHVVGELARFNDLVVLPHPYGKDVPEESAFILEAVLFHGHAPVLVCPPKTPETFGKRIVIGWNDSDEAMAAIKAALPLIAKADAVDVAIIDPKRHAEDQTDIGSNLSKMLTRHGARVTVSVLARTMPKTSDILERHAIDFDADMVVLGAYGHSRLRESIMGGTTRNVLEGFPLPVLMAR